MMERTDVGQSGRTDETYRNIDEQRVFFNWFKEFLGIIPKIQADIAESQREIKETQARIIAIDEKHTRAIENLQKTFGSKLDNVLAMNDQQNADLSDIKTTLAGLKPYLEYVTPVHEKWVEWRPRIIFVGIFSTIWVIISIINPSISPAALALFIKTILG